MIIYRVGNLLNSGCDIICHQVNLQGFMGGGLALQIARKFPKCEDKYVKFVQSKKRRGGVRLGEVCFVSVGEQVIANCFSQTEDFDTDYEAIEKCFSTVREKYRKSDGILSIGIPYGYGCGIANGDWGKVVKTVEKVFENERDVVCEIYELKA